VHNSVQAKL